MQKLILSLMVIAVIFLYVLGLRGLPGSPTAQELKSPSWRYDGPLELSPERGRYALVYSIVEDKSLQFSPDVAKLAIPDLAYSKTGQFVSLFAPGVSFIVAPGYLIGKYLGIAQVGTYFFISIFALLNFFLINLIARQLGAGKWSSFLGALTFAFATPAFAYGVNLYQHHISVFLLLISLYLVLKYNNYFSFALIWLACASSVVVDNPNLFLMLPVGLFALFKLVKINFINFRKDDILKPILKSLATFVAILPPILFFLWYNQAAYGDHFQLPGTLPSVSAIDENNKPVDKMALEKISGEEDPKHEKTAVGFFKTRNLYNGFYEHFISQDRGVLYFTPVILLGIFGLLILYGINPKITSLLVAILGFNVILYSMWGDPYGGWAFGSRYLIPSYAILSIGIAHLLSRYNKSWIGLILFAMLLIYSSGVNILGALTTSAIPTKAEVLSLEQKSGHEEKYNFMRSWEFLNRKYSDIGSKSYIYQAVFEEKIGAREYFLGVYGLFLVIALTSGVCLYKEDNKRINK